MVVVRALVGVLCTFGVLSVLQSVLRTVVLPRAVPARLGRVVFLAVRWVLMLRLRFARSPDYSMRDRVFSLQAPIGLFAQLGTWGGLILMLFAGIFWSLGGGSFVHAVELSGSSMLTLGFDRPNGLARHLVAFADAGVGLVLLALVITYLPSLYAAFSRRETLITRLVVRAGEFPTGPRLLGAVWELGRFAHLEEAWNAWETWFVELGETHTTFPQLPFFRSPHPSNHWVLAAETMLDGAGLYITACEQVEGSRALLLVRAGVNALHQIAEFLGIDHEPPADERELEIRLTQEQFAEAVADLRKRGVPVVDAQDEAEVWQRFCRHRSQYEELLAVLGRMTDAPRGEWSCWSDEMPRHSPPLLRIHRKPTDFGGGGLRR